MDECNTILKAYTHLMKYDIMQIIWFALGRLANILGKEENTGYQYFLFFLKCTQFPQVCYILDSVVKSSVVNSNIILKTQIRAMDGCSEESMTFTVMV